MEQKAKFATTLGALDEKENIKQKVVGSDRGRRRRRVFVV